MSSTVEEYATLLARTRELSGPALATALRERGLDESAWQRLKSEWQQALQRDAEAEGELTLRFAAAYRSARDEPSVPQEALVDETALGGVPAMTFDVIPFRDGVAEPEISTLDAPHPEVGMTGEMRLDPALIESPTPFRSDDSERSSNDVDELETFAALQAELSSGVEEDAAPARRGLTSDAFETLQRQ